MKKTNLNENKMKSNEISRRRFIGTVAAATTGVAVSGISPIFANSQDTSGSLALLGGTPSGNNGRNGIPRNSTRK